jgi:hypothetical protein
MAKTNCHQSLNGAACRACPGGLKPNSIWRSTHAGRQQRSWPRKHWRERIEFLLIDYCESSGDIRNIFNRNREDFDSKTH